jgi:hypothetical protein
MLMLVIWDYPMITICLLYASNPCLCGDLLISEALHQVLVFVVAWYAWLWLIDLSDAPGCICASCFSYLCLAVKLCFLLLINRHELLDAVVIHVHLCNLWMETNICWHLMLCLNS